MIRLLFIGQAPSQETEGKPPFTGKCGKFLAETLLNTTQEQMLEDHDFINVLNHWPGKGYGGDKFPLNEAIPAARGLWPTLAGRTVVLLGSNVGRAFGAKQFVYFQWYEFRDPQEFRNVICPKMAIVPHPSGVNRYWNNPNARLLAQKFFRHTLEAK